MAVQGKCLTCQVRYVFQRTCRIPLRLIQCPRCHGRLRATSHASTLQIMTAVVMPRGVRVLDEKPYPAISMKRRPSEAVRSAKLFRENKLRKAARRAH